jgi:hypothetical protein
MRLFKGGLIVDSYLVRIYRKDLNNPRMLVGIVQQVGAEEKEVFSNLDELWSILNPKKKTPLNRKKGRSPKRNPSRMSL